MAKFGFSTVSCEGQSKRVRPILAHSAKDIHMTTYVLVHGGWHGGWCWKRVTPFLRDAGHIVYTPTLTGLGERSHLASQETNLSTHIQDILNILWYEDLNDVILVGHSYGGMVITGAADAAPERVSKLVYLDAFVPEDGQSLMAIFRPASSQEASPKSLVWVLDKITPQPIQAFTEPIRLKNGGNFTIPRTYIYLRPPAGLPPETEFFQFAERARTQPDWKYHELVSGHDAMIIIPEAIAALLLEQDRDM